MRMDCTIIHTFTKYQVIIPFCVLLDIRYPSWELNQPVEIIKPRAESDTPLIMIEDESSMKELVDTLKQQQSIAVDLEHHDYRSYLGFTCLIQVFSFGFLYLDFDTDY